MKAAQTLSEKNMAFELQRFVRQTEALNSGALTLDDATVTNGPALYTYESAADALTAILAAGYFNSQWKNLFVGDFILATGNGVTALFRVSAIDTTLKTVTIVQVLSLSTAV